MTGQWCAIESAYTDHDTAHHGAENGLAINDDVKITAGEFEGKTGIVQQLRGAEVVVRIPSRRGNTQTVSVAVGDVERTK